MDTAFRKKVNLLIQLALIDGELDVRERAFIYNVCIRNGVDLDTIGDMIEKPEPIENPTGLSNETRIDYITDCLLLTLIDGKVLPKETMFVKSLAKQVGLGDSAMEILIDNIGSDMKISPEDLRKRVTEVVESNINRVS